MSARFAGFRSPRGARPSNAETGSYITLKALEKSRTHRYQTANALAADVRRYLAHEPIAARPPSTLYRTQRFVQRHRRGVAAAVLLVVALVLGTIVST